MPSHQMERFRCFLQHITPLDPIEAKDLISHFEGLYLKKNQFFQQAGMPVQHIGFVTEGILRRFVTDGNGNEIIVQFISEGHFFTDLDGFYEQKLSGANIQAIIPCRIYILPIDKLKLIQEKLPRLIPIITQLMHQHLLERIKMEEFLRMGKAADQYQYLMKNHPNLIQLAPLKFVASYLRITQQSLSRIRRER